MRVPAKTALASPLALLIASVGCSAADEVTTQMTEDQGYGLNPRLPEPDKSLIPTVKIAEAQPWKANETPTPAKGLSVARFACNLDHPRWLYVLPNGDLLVAETNAPERPEDKKGIKGYFMSKAMEKAGAATPSANRITLLRDANGDGQPEVRTRFLEGLNSPFGMALVENTFYVANTDAVVRFNYQAGATQIKQAGTKLVDLPGGPLNHHWTKNLIASRNGDKLYATVGSNSNVAENGIEAEEKRAAILEIDIASGATRVFASGLRNPNGMDWQPQSGVLWTVVNERDEIGHNLVPDYLTSVQEGGFYGWPYSYYGQHVDERVEPQRPDLVAKAIVPDYALGSHTASLGLAFYDGEMLPDKYRNGAFIGMHGSWNREPRSGYKVVFVSFANGRPIGLPEDVLTGFLSPEGEARGRPVGVAVGRDGALLVADDVGNCVWRVTPAASRVSQAADASASEATSR
ncbi:sorbosone dehydrogenase family protein [Steroidobacter sp. S1-65]|uniref:Sorbosone dehydrogenase family protein n=1 Tax=Steroidobacter gossypii TaxID=2805490 RepID=A0ABS1X219_9GAMM|nr:sorbosone dehydrogenase family protein [Steroidobacter gossypii]MBM0107217.1 sorbosone dehydrogenase family protein [Steroidobacter gossypii]